ncbi:MAG: galactose mutarotase [Propionibacteriaceae bacterium]|jgi:aldose 1-epimerase|nr:galactose mutarotase [Propionibacteriaceae bacterium]
MQKITLGTGEFTVEIWSRGACVNDIRMPDRDGLIGSVVLGYATEADRLASGGYLGEICGPFANRIAAGGFEIDGTTYTPDLNDNGTATLHGGPNGWSGHDWQVVHADPHHAHLHLDWADRPGSFPGHQQVDVEYDLRGWSLTHTIRVTTDQATVVSGTSHAYFNLSGEAETIDSHELWVRADRFLPIDAASIPLADAPWPVAGTTFDFRTPRRVGAALAAPDPQSVLVGGIDHALLLDGTAGPCARLAHPASGRQLEITTDCPALQVYTGQYLDNPVAHPAGAGRPRCGIALETEAYPDAPRRPDFPSALVRPGETYTRTTTWEFRTI